MGVGGVTYLSSVSAANICRGHRRAVVMKHSSRGHERTLVAITIVTAIYASATDLGALIGNVSDPVVAKILNYRC